MSYQLLLLFALPLWGEFVVQSLNEIRSQSLIRQYYEQSCGAASLATLINLLHHQSYNEKDILKLIDHHTDMVSFKTLEEIATQMGYKVKGYQISKEALDKITIPILVKIENDPKFPHFIITLNHAGDFITVFDPNFGEYVSLKSDFLQYRIPINKADLRLS